MRLAHVLVVFSLTVLTSCAGWEVRPESAIIMAPPDEVWNTAQDFLRERDFKVTQQDSTKRELQALREVVLRVITDKSTRGTVEKERHQINLSVKTRGDDASLVEVIYRIENLVVEDPAFRFIAALRDRIAISSGEASSPRPRR
jgi:hypothetical protein